MVDIDTLSIVLTGIGLMIAITYYTLTLRNANKTREAQLFIQIYSRLTPEFMEAWEEIYSSKMETFEDFQELYNREENPERYRRLMTVLTFYEGLGTLVKEGLVNIRSVSLMVGETTIQVWNVLRKVAPGLREEYGSDRVWSETEYLANRIEKYLGEYPDIHG